MAGTSPAMTMPNQRLLLGHSYAIALPAGERGNAMAGVQQISPIAKGEPGPDERSDIGGFLISVVPACRCAHAGYMR